MVDRRQHLGAPWPSRSADAGRSLLAAGEPEAEMRQAPAVIQVCDVVASTIQKRRA